MTQRWHLEQFDWSAVTPADVPPGLLQTVKTAALVEANSADYVVYLRNVFSRDADFVAAAELWGEEEALHGAALARVLRTVVDPFVGHLSIVKMIRERLAAGAAPRNLRAGVEERATHLFLLRGK